MPQHYIASIFLTSKRLQTREGIQLDQQSYLRFSPKNKRERNGVESITQLNHHKEAIPLQSVFKSAHSTVINQYDTKQEVVDHTLNHLSECFRLAYSAPCYQGQLFDNLGFMRDIECSKQILEGTYEYPPNTYVWTKKILQEAHYTFSRMSGAKIATTISTADFQQWQTDIILFQRCHLLALQSGGISFNALSNAHCVSVCMHTKRDTPCTLGDWAHCATGKDSWQIRVHLSVDTGILTATRSASQL
jgi:hypothetical protein